MRDNNKEMSNFKQTGFLSMPNDSIVKTLLVAISLCLVCSVIVSIAAVKLKPLQLINKQLNKKQNILLVAGIEDSSKSVDELFSQIETKVIDLETGEYTTVVDAETFDQRKASKDPKYRVVLSSDQDIAQIGGRSKYANVYLVKDGDVTSKIILPIKGYGLWSTLYGFLCLSADAQTACGINFYEHNETPGLGGEVDNPRWQASWEGKKIFNQQGLAEIALVKGIVDANTVNAEYKVDGLAGATLTSNGVTNLVHFWVGENGFGPYLQKLALQNKQKQFRAKQQKQEPVYKPAVQQTAVLQNEVQQELNESEEVVETDAVETDVVETIAVETEETETQQPGESQAIETQQEAAVETQAEDTQSSESEATKQEVNYGE